MGFSGLLDVGDGKVVSVKMILRFFILVIRGVIVWIGSIDRRVSLGKIMSLCWIFWIWFFYMVWVSNDFVIEREVIIYWLMIVFSFS